MPSPSGSLERGPIAAIGGAEDQLQTRSVLREVVELAGAGAANIAVIPTASRYPDTGSRYRDVFRDLGARNVTVLRIQRRADCAGAAVLDPLREATCVFFTGGNQLRLSTLIGGTPVARLIRSINEAGRVVAGTSAGAAFLSEHMIAYGEEGGTPRAGMVSVTPGLGLTHRVIIDQHFRQRDRLGRLLGALAHNPYLVGVGIDENTAAIIEGCRLRVVGAGAVTIVDPADLEHSALGYVRRGQPVCMIGIGLHILVHGGWFDLEARTAHAQIETAADVDQSELAMTDHEVKVGHHDTSTPGSDGDEDSPDDIVRLHTRS